MTGEEYLLFNQQKALTYDSLVENGYAGNYKVFDERVKEIAEISEDGFHCFAGYYDVDNISPNGRNLLYLKVDEKANPGVDAASIMVFDLQERKSKFICRTSAWCWQQGCRLRWIDDDTFIFNDCVGSNYVTKSHFIHSRETTIAFDHAFYDVSYKANVGLWVDFDRLQANRPGYGYSCNKIDLANRQALNSDGLFAMTLSDKRVSRLVSLGELSSQVISLPFDNHYINHVSISPNGKRVMFFHLWAKDSLDMWKMRTIVSDLDGSNRRIIEEANIVSHYAWLDDDILLLTRIFDNQSDYCFYNLKSGEKKPILSADLISDGHPTFLSKNLFISDTYPLENSMQYLFVFELEKNKRIPLLEIFSDPRLYIDKRCDLHPRVHKDGLLVNFDTTYRNGVRSIKILKLEGLL